MSLRYISSPGEPVYDVVERRHVDAPGARDEADLPGVFTTIYRTNRWGSPETRSGPGSERPRMKHVVGRLDALIRELGVRSVLDAPCGDFNWMRDVALEGVHYVGGDVVGDLVSDNARRYAGPGRTFRQLDFTTDALPQVDLILCRDALVHFSYHHVARALTRFKDSGSRYLLTTTFPQTRENVDITTGWWRPINLQLEPLALPAPLLLLPDDDSDDFYDDKALALWRIDQLPRFDTPAGPAPGGSVARLPVP